MMGRLVFFPSECGSQVTSALQAAAPRNQGRQSVHERLRIRVCVGFYSEGPNEYSNAGLLYVHCVFATVLR